MKDEESEVIKPLYKKWWFWVIVILSALYLIALVVIIIGGSNSSNNTTKNNETSSKSTSNEISSKTTSNKVAVTVIDFSTMSQNEIQTWCDNNKIKCNITEEYSDTVEEGEFVSQSVKANGTVFQGDKITIVYSLGKEPTNEQKNALKKAESYSKTMHMSKKGIYDQLTSSYGEGFTAEAAQYAIDNLQVDYNKNALEKAKTYQSSMHMSKQKIYEQLTSSYGEGFTKKEAQYAIDHLDD